MGNVVVFMEVVEGALRKASLPAVTFAREAARHHGGQVLGVVAGSGLDAAASQASQLVSKLFVFDAPALASGMAELLAPLIARVAKEQGATVVCATATNTGKDVLPRAAALLGCGMVSDVIAIQGPHSFKRPMLAGNAIAHVEVSTPTLVASVRQTEFTAAEPLGAAGELIKADPGPLDARGAQVLGVQATKSERPELTEARVVVSGGRGMREGKNFEILGQLADLLGGAMGASRAACDAGMVPNDLQVGQTGKVVAPELYIAVAISGAIQHLAGMKGSKVIVAINKDGEAPIFQVADYGLVGTWEQTIPPLIEEIKQLKAAQK
ncbi:MAG TPA: FAD-binding protein [Polyangia bacterium]|nr:FAD-binding protein [Polyangia bacterium]